MRMIRKLCLPLLPEIIDPARPIAPAQIGQTNITDNVSPGPGIQFNEKGQNDKLKDSAIQNRGGKLVTVAPKVAANAKVEWPMTPYDKRG